MHSNSQKAAAVLAAAAMATLGLGTSGSASAADDSRSDLAVKAVRSHAKATHAGPDQGFRVVDTVVDRDGTTHVRMDRTYKGLPVVGGDLVVHQRKGGAWLGRSQTMQRGLSLSTEARISQAAAEARATAPSAVTNRIQGQRVDDADLVVDATGSAPRLAWKIVSGGVQDDGTPSRLGSYVDARTGQLIRTEQEIVNVDGSGQSLYGGTVPLRLTQSGSSYQLKDPTRGGTYTTDVKNAEDSILCTVLSIGCRAGTTFTSPDTSFGNGSNSNRESAAVDAQYGTNMTWDYFQGVHGRSGIFGNGKGSYNRVHYGKNYVNAFWDGEKMTYGDGDGVDFGPLTSLDVAGHEMSHGVTENTAGLTYSGESGGLNEATSDIFGTMVEFHAANAQDPADYLIGEEFDLAQHRGFRRMDKPSSDGDSLDCWTTGAGNVDVHYSSGIGNHFFYLLAEGSGAKTIGGVAHNSPTCNGSVVAGIGRSAAEKIWFRALTVYMTSKTNYAGARTATLNAAKDLHGAGSSQYNAVAAAWSAVGVG